MTQALHALSEEGVGISREMVAALSPYLTSNTKRFGNYTLDMTIPPLAATSCIFYLLKRVRPTNTLLLSFLIPVFAVIAGVVFLNEPFTTSMLLGLGIIF